MIRLRCGNCGETLEVDDAFAGGVCRCSHCGTIQTVPADAAAAGDDASGKPVAGSRAPRALYRREEHQENRASGLDELADVVASSGALSSGLHRTASRGRRRGRGTPSVVIDPSVRLAGGGKQGADRKLILAVASAAVLAVIVVLLGVVLITRGEPGSSTSPSSGAAGSSRAMLGPIEVPPSVSFVIDTGSATQDNFATIAGLCLDVVERLPDGGRYQVVLWPAQSLGDDNPTPISLPSADLRSAADRSVERTRDRIAEVSLGGSTTVMPALEIALNAKPEAIILATGNTAFLDADFAREVVDRWRESEDKVPVYTVAVGASAVPTSLEAIADATGGTAIAMTRSELRAARSTFASRPQEVAP